MTNRISSVLQSTSGQGLATPSEASVTLSFNTRPGAFLSLPLASQAEQRTDNTNKGTALGL